MKLKEILSNAKYNLELEDISYNEAKAVTCFLKYLEDKATQEKCRFEIINCSSFIVSNKKIKWHKPERLICDYRGSVSVQFVYSQHIYKLYFCGEEMTYSKARMLSEEEYLTAFSNEIPIVITENLNKNNREAIEHILNGLIKTFPRFEEKGNKLGWKEKLERFYKFI